MSKIYTVFSEYQSAIAKYERLYVEGMREMNASKNYYPDANSTMRLTYGKIKD